MSGSEKFIKLELELTEDEYISLLCSVDKYLEMYERFVKADIPEGLRLRCKKHLEETTSLYNKIKVKF